MLTRCAVLGSPIGHSLSPVIHRAAYAQLGLDDWRYDAYEIDAAGFPAFLAGLDDTWRGLSCTMPLKEAAAACGEPDDDVRLTGVANTVVLDRGARAVHNTDIAGFADALRAAGADPWGPALLVGNGATARSALVALHRLGASRIQVLGRDEARVAAFVRWARERALPAEPAGASSTDVRVVVSTVPSVGTDELLRRLAGLGALEVVFDAIYHPWPTPLAARAAALGVTVLSGLELLVGQAAHQIRLMTGHDVPPEILMSAVRAELSRREQS